MKRLLIPFVALILITYGCKKADKLTQFDINYSTEFVVPATTTLNLPFDIITPDVETNADSKFQINDTRKDKIEHISLKELVLNLKSPSGSDFSFLKSVEIYLVADDISETRIAWKEEVSSSVGNTLELDVSDEDLTPYIMKDEFSLRVRTVTDEALTNDHTIEANSTFFVDAKLL